MEKFKIKEANKLIAEFMGFEYIGWNNERHRCSDYTSGYWGLKEAKRHSLKVSHAMMVNPLMYDCSWNSLMPVISKIEKLGAVDVIIDSNCTISWDDGCAYYKKNKSAGRTKIETVYESVIEFIMWYNGTNRNN